MNGLIFILELEPERKCGLYGLFVDNFYDQIEMTGSPEPETWTSAENYIDLIDFDFGPPSPIILDGNGGEIGNYTGNFTVPALPLYIRVTSTILCTLILFIGIVGNTLVPIVVWKNRELRNSTNIFLVNLSLADLLVLLICMPPTFVEIHADLLEVWVLGQAMCKIVPFAELSVAHASALIILAISLERYIAICRPLKANYTCTKNRAIIICISIWIIAFIATSPILIITKYEEHRYMDQTQKNVCLTSLDDFWTSFYFVSSITLFFIIPLIVLIALYWVISRNLMSDPCNNPSSSKCCPADHPNIRARKQVVVMLATVVGFFFVCLLPFRIFWLFIIVAPKSTIDQMGQELYYNILYLSRVMLYFNSAINPILYNVMSSKFRLAFFKVLSCLPPNSRGPRWLRRSTFATSSTLQTSSLKSNLSSNKDSLRAQISSPAKKKLIGMNGRSSTLNNEQNLCKSPALAKLTKTSSSSPYYPSRRGVDLNLNGSSSYGPEVNPDVVTVHSQHSHLLNNGGGKIVIRANSVV